MKNLKTIFAILLISLTITSCTDIITEDDYNTIDHIENTEARTNDDGGDNDDDDDNGRG